jgi:hydroxysqualene dehydroxylase
MGRKSVSVIGGGIAGLSAAVFLAEKDFDVTIYEASPKFGGRAYSFFDKTFDAVIDNGQHILASWYHNTFDYLKIIGSYDKLSFQKQLEVTFIQKGGKRFLLKAPKLPPPLHLAGGIFNYGAIGLKDKLALVRLVNSIKKGKFTDDELKAINTDKLFAKTGQTEKLIDNFWKPFIIAVFNAEPAGTSAYLFSEIIKLGFLTKGGSELVLPDGFLEDIFVKPALKYLESKNAKVFPGKSVTGINIEKDAVTSLIIENSEEVKSDLYISAVPFFNINDIRTGNNLLSSKTGLIPSPIVNIHLKFAGSIDDIISGRFAGLLNTRVQWVFKVKDEQLCLVISSADEIAGMDKEAIIKLAVKELIECFPEISRIKITASRVIKEMRATFLPDSDSLMKRPECRTAFNNFFLAGDWTDTGLPATIEGAVKSGKKCLELILNQK